METPSYDIQTPGVYETAPLLPDIAANAEAPKIRSGRRLGSLDVLRGFTVMVMIFVDNTGGWLEGHVNHSPWDRLHFADIVMPFFLFMVGASMSLSMTKYTGSALTKKVLARTAKLFVIGCLTQGAEIKMGGRGFDIASFRIPGILQRIAFAYGIVALMCLYLPKIPGQGWSAVRGSASELWQPHATGPHLSLFKFHLPHWGMALSFFFVNLALMLFWTVPSWSYTVPAGAYGPETCALVNSSQGQPMQNCSQRWQPEQTVHVSCDVRGIDTDPFLGPQCSATRAFDRFWLGDEHLFTNGCFRRTPACSSCYPAQCDCGPEPHQHCPGGRNNGSEAADFCGGQLDPEGALATLPTVLTTWIGVHFGSVLFVTSSHRGRLTHWAVLSTAMLVFGLVLEAAGWGVNKQLWSPSYLFVTAGMCGYCLATMYVIFDLDTLGSPGADAVQRLLRTMLTPMRWVGLNTIFIYLFAPSGSLFYANIQKWFYYKTPRNNLVDSFYRIFCDDVVEIKDGPWTYTDDMRQCTAGIFTGSKEKWAITVWTLFRIVCWTGVAGWLHRKRWYWAL